MVTDENGVLTIAIKWLQVEDARRVVGVARVELKPNVMGWGGLAGQWPSLPVQGEAEAPPRLSYQVTGNCVPTGFSDLDRVPA